MTTVIISGANRGIGLGLVQAYAGRENHTVIATARNPDSMPDVKAAAGSRVIVVQMDVSDVDSPKKAIAELQSKHDIKKLDIAICNAAIMGEGAIAPIAEIDPHVFEDHWRTNVLGFLVFFQACVPLLEKGSKFVFMSSGASIIDRVPDKKDVCYGITKAGANYLARYAHFEHPDLIIFPMSPGWVQTDMGNYAAVRSGLEKAPITVEQSASGMVKVIDDATRGSHGGEHLRYDGSRSKW